MLLLVVTRHSRGRKHRDQAIKWIRSKSEIAIPPKRVQSPPKIPNLASAAFNSLSSREKAIYCRILEN